MVLMDIDDFPAPTGSRKTLYNYECMLSKCNGVVVGCPQLEDYTKQFQSKTYLIPSGIRMPNYRIPNKVTATRREQLCVGWSGNARTYAPDLIEKLVEPLRIMASKYSIRFKIMGACGIEALYKAFGSIECLEIDFIDSLDWSSPKAVSECMADFDIGLFPLLDNHYNQFKCGFKALEYMALEIPVIASPVGVNKDILAGRKAGLLAETTEDWVEALEMLILDSDLRKEMGRKGRRIIHEQYSTKQLAKQWVNVLETSMK